MVNTGQMLLVLGALLLFTLMLPSLNETILYNDRSMVNTKAEMTAMTLAQRFLEEAGSKKFDEACVTGSPTLPSQMTPSGLLGRETGETYPNFDDVDDYNNLSFVDTLTLPTVRFNVAAAVTYINSSNPTQTSTSRTFIKQLRLTVTGPYLVNPASETAVQITLEQLYTFY